MKRIVRQLIEKAESFASQPNEWLIPGEIPPDKNTVKTACEWICRLFQMDLDNIDIFPGSNNSIFIAPIVGDLTIELEISEDKILSLESQKGIGPQYTIVKYEDYPEESDVCNYLQEVLRRHREQDSSYWTYTPQNGKIISTRIPLCTYVSFPPNVMTYDGIDMIPLVSKTMVDPFRFSPSVVARMVA